MGTYEDQQRISGHTDPFRAFQQTVETCALVICLWVSKAQIWDTYTKEEKDVAAGFLEGYAHANTAPQNWRLFNMLDMAFLHMEGYPIQKDVMCDHAQAILNYYAGDGWYRDGHSFDYYSCWAFNVYGSIWSYSFCADPKTLPYLLAGDIGIFLYHFINLIYNIFVRDIVRDIVRDSSSRSGYSGCTLLTKKLPRFLE